jgi:hypothetical protein
MQVGAGLGNIPIPAFFDSYPMGVRQVPWSTSLRGPPVDQILAGLPLVGALQGVHGAARGRDCGRLWIVVHGGLCVGVSSGVVRWV